MKNRLTHSFLLLFITCSQMPQTMLAQNAKDTIYYNLKQLVTIALENNKDLQLLKLELQKASQEVAIKKAGFLPKVDAFTDYYWYTGNVPIYVFPENEGKILSGGSSSGPYPVSIGMPNNLLAGVSLKQRIFEFSYLSSGKSKEILTGIESSRLKEKKEQLIYDVALCYYEISQLAAKEDFINFNIKRVNQFIDILEMQLKNQMTDSLQWLDLKLKKEELLLSKNEYKSGMQRKTNYLRMLSGLPDSIVVDYGKIDFSPVFETIQDQNNSGENSKMSLLNQAQNLNKLAQNQVQSDYLPTLDFNFNLLWSAQSQNLAFFSNKAFGNQVSTLGLKLDIPIYHGAEKKKKIQKLEIDQNILELQKQKMADGYRLQYSNSLATLEFKTARYKHQQEITQLKKRLYEKANKQFEQGILPVKELLDAQSSLMEAQLKLVEILFDVKLAELDYFNWSNQILARFE